MNNIKVTIEDVRANMQDVTVKTEIEFDKPVTVVTVRMRNGFTIRESTTCVDPDNYDESIGAKICLNKIEQKIWFLLGYELQNNLSDKKGLVDIDEEVDDEEADGEELGEEDKDIFISIHVPCHTLEHVINKWFS